MALKDSGVLAAWVVYEDAAPRLLRMADVQQVLTTLEHPGLAVNRAEYVVTDGLHWSCEPVAPCIAFRSGPATYLLGHGPVLYRVDDGTRQTVGEHQRVLRERGLRQGREEGDPLWVGVGFERRRAHPVAGRP